ncbi:hypothetical protein LU631_12430 [Erwinia tracheiphila]|uniref:Uncharacterized protein n=1 Tax=Erwinia tracheiphila TaxID=65700 RepID=A0A0M2KFE4_9GAMM|nr:hypothetical protein [Erwinia tracheiphila]AXF75559.1 hypothetical protein AV903_04730 [Erwinia tracheiphila]EOS92925.1 hypothetical protein ETR_21812 [Erwinia tracheiphila PSU-1]KKF35676.1 hypothetical protein SY86_09975 [Erwinia tracheiphila]UIA81892.1 hypothetical protein LU604_14490 [Erwinia tracheiphila]UIA89849.1 hypothetical protein LU631_12430 [Erwinia tracheiphila]
MSQAACSEHHTDRLEEAKNIALGWRIIGQITPDTLEDAITLLRDCSAHAAAIYELLSVEINENAKYK